LRIGQGLNQYPIDDTEDGGIRADAQSQRYQRDGGEGGRQSQASKDVFQGAHAGYYDAKRSECAKIFRLSRGGRTDRIEGTH
jgi:hypothetical protein